MRRRDFITILGGAAAWPLAARAAQQAAMPVIGVLGSTTADAYSGFVTALRQGLSEVGFVEGRNLAIEYRWADDQYDRLPMLAGDLVRRRVSLIVAVGNQLPARAAKAATSTIPIVFAMGADPVSTGLVASLSRPGGNVTGSTQLAGPLVAKRLQLLLDLVPNVKVFGALANPENNVSHTNADAQGAARSLGRRIEIANARTEGDLDAAFTSLMQKRVDALTVLPDTLFTSHAKLLGELAARYHIPTIYPSRVYAKAGGFASYGAVLSESYHQAGIYAGRILKGEKPSNLPVIEPTKFELVINLKTAGELGLTVSRDMQSIADEVIE